MTIVLYALLMISQQPTLLQQVIPQPTGASGYEEYLQAADIVNGREFKAFKRWNLSATNAPGTVAPPQGLSAASSELERKKYAVQAFGKALKLVSAGNLKSTSRGQLAVFVEGGAFRDIAKLGIDAAYISYSKGDWTAGTNQLLEILVFGDNVSRETTMGNIVGRMMIDQCLAAFDAHKSEWSVKDCEKITATVNNMLAATPSIGAALEKTVVEGILPTDEPAISTLRARAQFRLLRINALIQNFRWQNGRLPTQLAEAVPASESLDPLSGESFHYVPLAQGYKVFSKGNQTTGEIQLTYVGVKG